MGALGFAGRISAPERHARSPVRFIDPDRVLLIAVRELVEVSPPSGHLVLDVAQRSAARLAAGRAAHAARQAEQAGEGYRPEVGIRVAVELEGWTVHISGRVDGLSDEGGDLVVEEIKSTALDARRLYTTNLSDWPAWTAQLEVYLWMLHRNQSVATHRGGRPPSGRLVLVSLLDGSRHILPVTPDLDRIGASVLARLTGLVRDRERRNAWMAERRARRVPAPFPAWREKQRPLRDAVEDALDAGRRLLAQAPTGLGKTAAVLHGALSFALREDKRLFWATSRNTQAAGVSATLQRFREAGLPLRWVVLRAKEKVCLNEVVACRPDTCRFAAGYHDRRLAAGLVGGAVAEGGLLPERAMALGREHTLCPYQLVLDLADEVDVIVGDANYAISPQGRIGRWFGEDGAPDTVLVVDEAHQLVERARDHASPRIRAADVRAAMEHLRGLDADRAAPWLELARDALDGLDEVLRGVRPPLVHGAGEADLLLPPWRELAERIDALAFDYAWLKAAVGAAGTRDPWLELAWSILRFVDVAETADEAIRTIVRVRAGEEEVKLVCVDPSGRVGPELARLGGLIGCSATLSPPELHRSLLGLPEETTFFEAGSPFPEERRAVLVVPEVSTAWRDRAAHAAATVEVLAATLAAVPGNVVVFFPSFELMGVLLGSLDTGGRRVVRQAPELDEAGRASVLASLTEPGPPVLLAAVLGGVFAEGIDPPPGALDAVVILGPSLPPPDLERRLHADHLEERWQRGFVWAYLVPGLTRVAQAGGRLIRRDSDRGVIVLIDRRFQTAGVQGLLPADWKPRVTGDLAGEIASFFAVFEGDRAGRR